MTRLFAVFLALLVSLPAYAVTPASPARVDEAGAAALKPRLVEALNGFESSLAASGISLKREGELLVEPAGTYYAITTPSLALGLPDGVTRTIGMVAINAIPTADADVFKAAIALPTPMIDTNASGENIGSLSIGQQAMNGLWNLKAMAFTELKGSYQNLHAINRFKDTELTIPDLSIDMKLTPSGDLWSGPTDIVMSNLTYRSQGLRQTVANAHIKTRVDQLDLRARKSLSEGIATGDRSLSDLTTGFVTSYAQGLESSIVLRDIGYQQNLKNGQVRSGGAKASTMDIKGSNLKANAADVTFRADVNGMYSDDKSLASLTPTTMTIKGSATKLPLAKLSAAPDYAARRAAFQQSDATLKIDTFKIDAPGFGIDGKFAAQDGGGNIYAAIRGLDDLLVFLATPAGAQSIGMPGGLPPQILTGLTAVQLAGSPSKDAQGRAVRTYDITFAKDGRVLLNGTDMTAVSKTLGTLRSQLPQTAPAVAPVVVDPVAVDPLGAP